ncbi:MAG: hypothetical protein ACK5AZ_14160 [Bryobacteraceae bacterium]
MPLPEQIRVKLSTEAVGTIAITPVVVRDMPSAELVELMLAPLGKDARRIAELLHRGSLVSGATRFRWEGIEAEPPELDALLAAFPDPEPSRAFQSDACTLAILQAPATRIEVSREVASRKGLLRRRSYWDLLMSAAASAAPQYAGYSYRERADVYQLPLDPAAATHLRGSARLLRYRGLAFRIQSALIEAVELYTIR